MKKDPQPNGMTPIKKIAGEMLLYFYLLQRRDVSQLSDKILSFQMRYFSPGRAEEGPLLNDRNATILNIVEFEQYRDADLLNSLTYLGDCGLIDVSDSQGTVDHTFLNIRVTARGIDLIEGIERGEKEKTEFNVTFNFNVSNNVTVESLLRTELGSLFKLSLT